MMEGHCTISVNHTEVTRDVCVIVTPKAPTAFVHQPRFIHFFTVHRNFGYLTGINTLSLIFSSAPPQAAKKVSQKVSKKLEKS